MKNSKSGVDDRGHHLRSGSPLMNYPHAAAHFPIHRDERTAMQRAILGRNGYEAASQLQGRIAKAISSNSLVNTMDMTAAIQYILTAAQSLGSQVYYKKSQMTILELPGVFLFAGQRNKRAKESACAR